MKKLLIVLVVLGISLQGYAGIKEKDVVGTWTYKVETPEGDITGKLVFELKDKKLVGEVQTSEGEFIDITNIKIKENDVLYAEVETGYEVLTINMTIKGKSYEGTVESEQGGSMIMSGEKVE